MWSNWDPHTSLVGMLNGIGSEETVWSFLKQLNIESLGDIPSFKYPKELNQVFKHLHINVHMLLFT